MKKLTSFIFYSILTLSSNDALAHDIQSRMRNMQSLVLNYGANDISIDQQNFQIIRALRQTGTAGNKDAFITIALKNDKTWQLVPTQNIDGESFLTWQAPHTYEDSFSRVHFLKDQESKNLYLLYAERELEGTSIEPSYAEISIYVLEQENDFDSFYFKKIQSIKTEHVYCNVDWALFKEAGIALPADGNEYDCDKLQ